MGIATEERALRLGESGRSLVIGMTSPTCLSGLSSLSFLSCAGFLTLQVINTANAKGQTALMLACKGGHYACVRFLLSNGANPTAADAQV